MKKRGLDLSLLNNVALLIPVHMQIFLNFSNKAGYPLVDIPPKSIRQLVSLMTNWQNSVWPIREFYCSEQ